MIEMITINNENEIIDYNNSFNDLDELLNTLENSEEDDNKIIIISGYDIFSGYDTFYLICGDKDYIIDDIGYEYDNYNSIINNKNLEEDDEYFEIVMISNTTNGDKINFITISNYKNLFDILVENVDEIINLLYLNNVRIYIKNSLEEKFTKLIKYETMNLENNSTEFIDKIYEYVDEWYREHKED